MTTITSRLRCALTIFTLTLAATCVHAAGFQHGLAADPDDNLLEIGIWYPSQATATPMSMSMGPTTMSVAINTPRARQEPAAGGMSHGNGGSLLSHFDTAVALADAGFVVVAVIHTGDNYANQSRSLDVMDRPPSVRGDHHV